jgi:galactokinase
LIPRRLLDAAPSDPDVVVRAPGRANIIGEHTDYNDGFVLPVALDSATYIAGRRRADVVRLVSLQEPREVTVDLRTGAGPTSGWGAYVSAVVRALRDASVVVDGLDAVVHSEVPVGAGLSSSAALEVGLALALSAGPLDPVRVAQICRRAERSYVGVDVGIMDQLACAAARARHALLIDCRDNSIEHVPVPEDVTIVVVDSGVRRALGASAYNERRAQCRSAAALLGVASLRDARPDDVASGRLDEVLRRRARHVITENERVLRTAQALRRADLAAIGRLLYASHESLTHDYEVSTPELDALVAAALATEGVFGARLTGAGFGGCTVNLVDAARARDAGPEIVERYEAATGRPARYWVSRPAEAAGRIPVERLPLP